MKTNIYKHMFDKIRNFFHKIGSRIHSTTIQLTTVSTATLHHKSWSTSHFEDITAASHFEDIAATSHFEDIAATSRQCDEFIGCQTLAPPPVLKLGPAASSKILVSPLPLSDIHGVALKLRSHDWAKNGTLLCILPSVMANSGP
jgi:hypothetical protein